MKHLPSPILILATLVFTAGCGRRDQPQTRDQPADRSDALERSRESEAVEALKQLGANVALDEQGRVKVLRLKGPKVTDAELEHVAALTELRALYLEGTQVTDAGMAHLEPLKKLERLSCVVGITSAKAFRTMEALKQPTVFEFIDTPLLDVLETLQDYHQIPFKIDEEALKGTPSLPLAPVSAKDENVSLREGLTSILGPLGLVWTIDDAVLVVTTEEALAKRWPNLAKLREAVPTLKEVTVDFQAAPEPAGKP